MKKNEPPDLKRQGLKVRDVKKGLAYSYHTHGIVASSGSLHTIKFYKF